MNNHDIIKLLVSKAQQKKLASFYLVQNHPHLSSSEFYQWMNQLLTELLRLDQRKTASQLTAIPDVDTLILHSEERQYRVDQVHSILRQLHYSSFTQKHRYWVIRDAHKCTPLIYNKLLKTLEEPPADTSIFLLNSRQSDILPTVKGRAVTLRLSLSKEVAVSSGLATKSFSLYLQESDPELAAVWDEKLPYNELAQKIQALQGQDRFIRIALNWCQAQLIQFEQCEHFLQLIQFLARQKKFYGRAQTQLVLLIQWIMAMPRSLTL